MKKTLMAILIISLLLLSTLAFAAARPDGYNSIYFVIDYVGGGVGDLDSLDITGASTPNTYDLIDGDQAVVVTKGESGTFGSMYVFDADGTDAEDTTNFTVIRPDDYSTQGVWLLVHFLANGLNIPGVKFHGAITVSGLPGSPYEGDLYLITDGDGACDEITGGGYDAYYLYYTSADWVCIGGGGSGSETDPIVAAINGIVKSNGTTISAAVADTDYQAPLHGWAGSATLGAATIIGDAATWSLPEKLYDFTPSLDDSWAGPHAIVKAGETLSQWNIVYLKYSTDGARAYAYDAGTEDSDNDTYPPAGVVVTSGTISAGDSIYIGIIYGVGRHDPDALDWGFAHATDEGKPVYASDGTAGTITLTPPSDSGDHVVRVGTVVEVDNSDNGDVILFNFGFADVTVP